MIYSWKSNDLNFKNASEHRMQELDKKLKLMVDKIMESAPVHKGIQTIAKNYVKLGYRVVNGKTIKMIKKVA